MDPIHIVVTVQDGDLSIDGAFTNEEAAQECLADNEETYAGFTEVLSTTVEERYVSWRS